MTIAPILCYRKCGKESLYVLLYVNCTNLDWPPKDSWWICQAWLEFFQLHYPLLWCAFCGICLCTHMCPRTHLGSIFLCSMGRYLLHQPCCNRTWFCWSWDCWQYVGALLVCSIVLGASSLGWRRAYLLDPVSVACCLCLYPLLLCALVLGASIACLRPLHVKCVGILLWGIPALLWILPGCSFPQTQNDNSARRWSTELMPWRLDSLPVLLLWNNLSGNPQCWLHIWREGNPLRRLQKWGLHISLTCQ